MLLHEYTHFIKQTIFPSDMLAVISTLRATAYTLISIGVMLLFQLAMIGDAAVDGAAAAVHLHPVHGVPDRHVMVPVRASAPSRATPAT